MRYKKQERDFGGEKGRKKKKQKEVKLGQDKNALERTDHGEKTPESEIASVLSYILRQDKGDVNMPATADYIKWLEERMTEKEFTFSNESFSDFEQITSSVGAGGAGRQTARNARARRHIVTGIRATAEESRKALPNEKLVMEKLEKRVKRHLENWRLVLSVSGVSLESQVLDRIAKLDKK